MWLYQALGLKKLNIYFKSMLVWRKEKKKTYPSIIYNPEEPEDF